jgi:ribosomal protein S18 acetylase RimI-like enzyme
MKIRSSLKTFAGEHPLTALEAVDQGRVVGRLRGAFMAGGYRVVELCASREAAAALLEHVRAAFPGERLEAIGPPNLELAAQLEAAGHERLADRVIYGRTLDDVAPPEGSPLSFKGYGDIGKGDFLDALARVVPAEELAAQDITAEELLEELLHCAGGLEGTALWQVAYLDGAVCGVIMPQARYPRAEEGSILQLGVVAELRGRGLGALLHAHALCALRAAGVRRYIDSTSVSNAAMLRVFERAGCRRGGVSSAWVRRRPAGAARVERFTELVAELHAIGHRPEVRDPEGWARIVARHGRHEAAVDLLWLRHRRMVLVMHCFPFNVPQAATIAVARAVCQKNDALDLAGFNYDAEKGALRFQIAVLPDGPRGIAMASLRRAIAATVQTVGLSTGFWEGFVSCDRAPAWASSWSD